MLSGIAVAKDEGLAADWFRKAADRGNDEAQFQLGYLLLYSKNILRRPEEAFALFPKNQTDRGYAPAQSACGITL
jgi:TPR repeat protein